jgi:hypothetical protein
VTAGSGGGLAAIEWGFHATMLACGVVIASFFWRVLTSHSVERSMTAVSA